MPIKEVLGIVPFWWRKCGAHLSSEWNVYVSCLVFTLRIRISSVKLSHIILPSGAMESTLISRLHNFTVEDDVDHFERAYAEPILKWVMISFYFTGLVAIVGLGIVSWFERSGEAGPYRTLINRLTSYNIEMVSQNIKFKLIGLVATNCFHYCSWFHITWLLTV